MDGAEITAEGSAEDDWNHLSVFRAGIKCNSRGYCHRRPFWSVPSCWHYSWSVQCSIICYARLEIRREVPGLSSLISWIQQWITPDAYLDLYLLHKHIRTQKVCGSHKILAVICSLGTSLARNGLVAFNCPQHDFPPEHVPLHLNQEHFNQAPPPEWRSSNNSALYFVSFALTLCVMHQVSCNRKHWTVILPSLLPCYHKFSLTSPAASFSFAGNITELVIIFGRWKGYSASSNPLYHQNNGSRICHEGMAVW